MKRILIDEATLHELEVVWIRKAAVPRNSQGTCITS